ncbi:hypothetical protein IAG41_11480 [Sphingomonas sp. JC676]|uniref:hypothetical protein n=1 Tax=Sphingomonas sp. JC676 TaxID=2768065 RepID=UPI00165784AE|nr:hypothetical protein [Sphingomonas sp. JC676]MBC9033017.1 hypothetical protein [Sphingomonas sp. JC676]
MTIHADLAERLRKAARNGTRLHLEPAHVKALLSPGIYGVISTLEAEELNALCDQDNQLDETSKLRARPDISSGRTGSGIVPTATTGRSVGSMVEQRAAEALASEEALRICRRKKRSTN